MGRRRAEGGKEEGKGEGGESEASRRGGLETDREASCLPLLSGEAFRVFVVIASCCLCCCCCYCYVFVVVVVASVDECNVVVVLRLYTTIHKIINWFIFINASCSRYGC